MATKVDLNQKLSVSDNRMKRWRIGRLATFNGLAALLLMSWFFDPSHLWWLAADKATFWFFNDSLRSGSDAWRMLWAVTNHRLFDLVSALAFVGVFALSARRLGPNKWVWHISILTLTILAAFIGTRIGHLLPVERASGSVVFGDTYRLSEWANFKTKDLAYSTFPGDHGMIAFIAVAFTVHYLDRRYWFASILAAVVMTLPRIVGGAHWLSDELIGAGFVALIVASWLFCTPLAEFLLCRIERFWLGFFAAIGRKIDGSTP